MITIIQGEDKAITVRLEDENRDAYDLTALTEATAVFKNADNTTISKTKTSGAIVVVGGLPQNGKLRISLSDTETNALKTGKSDFELLLDEGVTRKIVQFQGQLTVKARLL